MDWRGYLSQLFEPPEQEVAAASVIFCLLPHLCRSVVFEYVRLPKEQARIGYWLNITVNILLINKATSIMVAEIFRAQY